MKFEEGELAVLVPNRFQITWCVRMVGPRNHQFGGRYPLAYLFHGFDQGFQSLVSTPVSECENVLRIDAISESYFVWQIGKNPVGTKVNVAWISAVFLNQKFTVRGQQYRYVVGHHHQLCRDVSADFIQR